MKRLLLLGLTMLMVSGIYCPVGAGQAEDSQVLVEQALDMCKNKGRKATLDAINDRNGPFVKGQVYVFAMSLEDVVLAHPVDHTIRRMKLTNLKDNNGVPFIRKLTEVAQLEGEGWVEYLWVKPGTEKPSKKRTYLKRVPNEDVYFAAGYYVD